MKRIKSISKWLLAAVMRRFLRAAEEFEEVVEQKEEHEKPCEKKIVSIKIILEGGNQLSFAQEYDRDNPVTYIQCYYEFYKWFFMRESEWFSFTHRTGTKIIARDNIKQIDFDYSYKAENVV